MNWFLIAQRDYAIYQEKSRIKNYVANSKITSDQYTEITGDPYQV